MIYLDFRKLPLYYSSFRIESRFMGRERVVDLSNFKLIFESTVYAIDMIYSSMLRNLRQTQLQFYTALQQCLSRLTIYLNSHFNQTICSLGSRWTYNDLCYNCAFSISNRRADPQHQNTIHIIWSSQFNLKIFGLNP